MMKMVRPRWPKLSRLKREPCPRGDEGAVEADRTEQIKGRGIRADGPSEVSYNDARMTSLTQGAQRADLSKHHAYSNELRLESKKQTYVRVVAAVTCWSSRDGAWESDVGVWIRVK